MPLDHGVLELRVQSLKDSAEGFSQYFNERAKRASLHYQIDPI